MMIEKNTKDNYNTLPYQALNIDINEVTKFSSAAVKWWDVNGEFKFLHRINSIRLNYILECVNGLFKKKVLDVGCGGGILAESMAIESAKVTGLDASTESIAIAQLHAKNNGIHLDYRNETVEEHAYKYAGIYDVVTCMEMLEHVPHPESVVHSCARLVKPGGDVFFSTINRNIKSWLIAIIGAEYVLRLLPKGTHNIKRFIKPVELLSWIDKALLIKQNVVGLHYNLLRNRFYFSNDISVNYILHARLHKCRKCK